MARSSPLTKLWLRFEGLSRSINWTSQWTWYAYGGFRGVNPPFRPFRMIPRGRDSRWFFRISMVWENHTAVCWSIFYLVYLVHFIHDLPTILMVMFQFANCRSTTWQIPWNIPILFPNPYCCWFSRGNLPLLSHDIPMIFIYIPYCPMIIPW